MQLGNRDFDFKNETYIMGILNITPDSFSDGGYYYNLEKALKRAEEIKAEGGGIIDIGGESTRPGAVRISAKEEWDRIALPLKEIVKKIDIPVSVDTFKGEVAKKAVEAGAGMINDINGLQGDELLGEVAGYYKVPVCAMMNRRLFEGSGNILKDLDYFFQNTFKLANKFKISYDRLILDPGIGFGVTSEESFKLIHHLDYLKKYNCPILLGASRKRIIWQTLEVSPQEGFEGTLAITAIGVFKGASIIRVHDVAENVKCMKIAKEILLNK